MGNVIRYNPYADRSEMIDEVKEAFFTQKSEQLKALISESEEDDNRYMYLDDDLYYNISKKYIPNLQDLTRHFTTRQDKTLIDNVNGNDAPILPLVSTILATSVAEFADLTGVIIVSYSGDQLLSISGNNIVSSGTGDVFDLRLSDGTYIPFLHLKTDVSGNDNHILNITDIDSDYRLTGSTYLIDNGFVERNPELIPQPLNFNIEWTPLGIVVIDNDAQFTTTGSAGLRITGLTDGIEYVIKIVGSTTASGVRVNNYASAVGYINIISPGPFSTEKLITSNGDGIYLRNSSSGVTIIDDFSIKLATPEIIPNRPDGTPTYPLEVDDKFVAGTSFINTSPFLVRLYKLGDADPAKTFFDRSNTLIWKDAARNSVHYDTENTGDFHSSELTQGKIYEYVQDAYKYMLWSKIVNYQFRDIFLYPSPLPIDKAVIAGNYVGVPVVIPYEVAEGNYQVSEGDYLVLAQ